MKQSNCCGACYPTCEEIRISRKKHVIVGLIIALSCIYGYIAYKLF